MGLSPVLEDTCMHCGEPIVRARSKIPLCDECFEKLPSEDGLAREVYVIIEFAVPLETAQAKQERRDAYRAWIYDPDLANLPDGCTIVGDADTVEVAFAYASESSLVVAAKRVGDNLQPIACALGFPLDGFPAPLSTAELQRKLKHAEELRDQAVKQCERERQRWLRAAENERARKIEEGDLGRHHFLDFIATFAGHAIFIEREIQRVQRATGVVVVDDEAKWTEIRAEILRKLQAPDPG